MARAESRLSGITDRVDREQTLSGEEIRFLLRVRRHELLLGYNARWHARTGQYHAIVKAGTTWRAAGEPGCALRGTALQLGCMGRLSGSARCAVLTTRGEAFLDRRKLVQAMEAGLQAVACAGNRSRFYQLLGAVLTAGGEMTAGELHFAGAGALAGSRDVGRPEKAQHAEIKRQRKGPER